MDKYLVMRFVAMCFCLAAAITGTVDEKPNTSGALWLAAALFFFIELFWKDITQSK